MKKHKSSNNNFINFNIFSFLSTFVRSLIEIFISLYLFKKGFSIKSIILFYFIANLLAIPIAYIYAKIGEKTKYSYIMIFGYISFIILQIILRYAVISNYYILLIAFMYSLYRRGYWVSRRFYITNVIPDKKSSCRFLFVIFGGQGAKILSGYVGSLLLGSASMLTMIIISSIILFISLIPLSKITYESKHQKIELFKNLKKSSFKNLLAFSFFELDDLMAYLFPIYIAIYINTTYTLAGNLNALNNVAIIIFSIIYAKIINEKRNYFVLSTLLVIISALLKLSVTNYLILIVYFIDGIILMIHNQSINKIYFEERNNIDPTHQSLIYQVVECISRSFVALFLLLFIKDVKSMILVVNLFILFMLSVYLILDGKRKE